MGFVFSPILEYVSAYRFQCEIGDNPNPRFYFDVYLTYTQTNFKAFLYLWGNCLHEQYFGR